MANLLRRDGPTIWLEVRVDTPLVDALTRQHGTLGRALRQIRYELEPVFRRMTVAALEKPHRKPDSADLSVAKPADPARYGSFDRIT